MALEDELIDKNPAAKIKNEKNQLDPPDPFSKDEAKEIIDYLKDEHLGPYFEFMFYAGLRPSEAIAIKWSDVDLRKGYVRVNKARLKGYFNKSTKTAVVRDVLLNENSRSALQRRQAKSYLAGEHVFLTEDGEPYRTEKAQRSIFTRALKKLGIRHRPQYNTRHTYATMLLMAGVNPAFVAKQLGNSVVMVLTVYSTWITGESDKLEMAVLHH